MGCLVSQLAAKFAFFPPKPPTYQVKGTDKLHAVLTTSTLPIPIDDSFLDVLSIRTKRGNRIVAFYLRNPYARLTVLYSHGNAADLGQLYDLFVQLKTNLRVNLIGYDYSGYGASTGKPSEFNTYADIEAVYECLQTEYGIDQESLILYGQSVGSGPTLHLAARLPRLRGVVLHSAILSGLRVLCHVNYTPCCDIYKNVKKIRKVKCPVLVIHGTEDDVVDWLHGNGLWKMARDPYDPLWIKGGGHCNLELYPDYVRHLSKFIKDMENTTTLVRLRKLHETHPSLFQPRQKSCFPCYCCCCYCCEADSNPPKTPEQSDSCCCCIPCCGWPSCRQWQLPACLTPSCTCCSCQCKKCSCSCRMFSCLFAVKCSCL